MKLDQIGWKELSAINGEHAEQTVATIRETSPVLAENLVDHAFGSIFAQTSLSRRERELLTVGILGALGGAEPQVRVHLAAALRVGADLDELVALAEHLSVYAGYPRALNLLRDVREAGRAAGKPVPLVTRRIPLDGHQTRVFDSAGDKPAMILVHALGLDHRMWRDVIPVLAEEYRVIAYDLRGHGAAAGAPAADGLVTYAQDLTALLDTLGIATAHVVGLSLGGSIAQEFALSCPKRMRSLTVIASTAWPFDAFNERAHAAVREGMEAQVVPSLLRWFRPEDIARNGWAVRYARDSVERAFVADWVAGWDALANITTGERLHQIAVPTHVIAAEQDASTPPQLMKRMLTVPGSVYSEIAGAPHMVSLTHPQPLAEAILRGIAT